jgi:hypothetical protein
MPSDYPFATWWLAFVWTNALELPVYVLLLRRRFPRWWEPVALTFLVNTISHPTFWYLLPRFGPDLLWIWLAEAWVTVLEAAIVFAALRLRAKDLPAKRAALLAFGASLAANVFSSTAGLLIWQ